MVTGPTGQEMSQAQLKLYEFYRQKAQVEDARQSNEAAEVRQVFMGDYSDGDSYGKY